MKSSDWSLCAISVVAIVLLLAGAIFIPTIKGSAQGRKTSEEQRISPYVYMVPAYGALMHRNSNPPPRPRIK